MKIIIRNAIYEDTFVEHLEIDLPDDAFNRMDAEEINLAIRKHLLDYVRSVKAAMSNPEKSEE